MASCGVQNDAAPPPGNATVPSTVTITVAASEITPTSTSTSPTQTPTLTPIPTLSPENALESFVDLIENDSQCNLPCWLNITPGETKFDEVKNNFLQYSAVALTEFSSKDAYIRVFFPSIEATIHNTATEVFSARSGTTSQISVYAGMNPDENGKYNFENPTYQKMWQQYFLPGVFTEHGVPEKIFLDTTLLTVDPAMSYPYVLWIVYPQKGFLLQYAGINIKSGENIKICPMQSRIQIIIWDLKNFDYEEFIENDGAGGISLGPQPIESVTNFNIESFFEFFKEGKLDTCFTTPASHWPPN